MVSDKAKETFFATGEIVLILLFIDNGFRSIESTNGNINVEVLILLFIDNGFRYKFKLAIFNYIKVLILLFIDNGFR